MSSKTKTKKNTKEKETKEVVTNNDRTIIDGIFDIFKFMFRLFACFILFGVSVMLFAFSVLLIISIYIY